MTPANFNNKLKEGKQFRLVKHFAWASFLVLLIFCFPFSVFIAQKAKDILVTNNEEYALIVSENLKYQVLQNYLIPILTKFDGKIPPPDDSQLAVLDNIVTRTIYGFNIDLVNLYSLERNVIYYSTDPDLIGQETPDVLGYKKALKGEHSSELISRGIDFLGIELGGLNSEKKIRTYIPFYLYLTREGKVIAETLAGVFEIIQDMTEEYESIVKFQYFVFALSIVIMALIFISLLLIVHKAEGIIRQRAKEQKELEEQLHLAERLAALGEMVAGVSHEIKNPLGIIRSTSELMGQMPDTTEAQKKLSGVITEESERLNNIVTEFLDFARPPELNLHNCLLDEIIRKNLDFLALELEKSSIRVTDNLGDRSFNLKADHDLLYRAFLNIFINSMQAINGSGSISIRIEEEKGAYRIEIRDSGSGITQENLKKIFNPFFTTKEKGSGLGLPIVRKIIEGHRGTIWIENNEDKGTCVTVTLPQKLR
jgi:signal transduction histidine kinase